MQRTAPENDDRLSSGCRVCRVVALPSPLVGEVPGKARSKRHQLRPVAMRDWKRRRVRPLIRLRCLAVPADQKNQVARALPPQASPCATLRLRGRNPGLVALPVLAPVRVLGVALQEEHRPSAPWLAGRRRTFLHRRPRRSALTLGKWQPGVREVEMAALPVDLFSEAGSS